VHPQARSACEAGEPMNRLIRTAAWAVAASMAGVSLASAQAVTLRYRYAKGDVAVYQVTSQVETTLGGLPMGEIKLGQTLVQSIEARVEDVASDGTTTMRQTFKSEKMEMTTPVGPVSYDSAASKPAASDPITGLVAATLGALVGESVTVVMSATGSVLKVEGMAKIIDKISANLPSDP